MELSDKIGHDWPDIRHPGLEAEKGGEAHLSNLQLGRQALRAFDSRPSQVQPLLN